MLPAQFNGVSIPFGSIIRDRAQDMDYDHQSFNSFRFNYKWPLFYFALLH